MEFNNALFRSTPSIIETIFANQSSRSSLLNETNIGGLYLVHYYSWLDDQVGCFYSLLRLLLLILTLIEAPIQPFGNPVT